MYPMDHSPYRKSFLSFQQFAFRIHALVKFHYGNHRFRTIPDRLRHSKTVLLWSAWTFDTIEILIFSIFGRSILSIGTKVGQLVPRWGWQLVLMQEFQGSVMNKKSFFKGAARLVLSYQCALKKRQLFQWKTDFLIQSLRKCSFNSYGFAIYLKGDIPGCSLFNSKVCLWLYAKLRLKCSSPH